MHELRTLPMPMLWTRRSSVSLSVGPKDRQGIPIRSSSEFRGLHTSTIEALAWPAHMPRRNQCFGQVAQNQHQVSNKIHDHAGHRADNLITSFQASSSGREIAMLSWIRSLQAFASSAYATHPVKSPFSRLLGSLSNISCKGGARDPRRERHPWGANRELRSSLRLASRHARLSAAPSDF